jgi:hypothetical protein
LSNLSFDEIIEALTVETETTVRLSKQKREKQKRKDMKSPKGLIRETICLDAEPEDAGPGADLNDSNVFVDGDPSKQRHRPPRGRRVRIRKIVGQNAKDRFPVLFTGWEQNPPEVGKHYRISIDERKIFSSSPVTRVYIQTKNSLYSIEYVQD